MRVLAALSVLQIIAIVFLASRIMVIGHGEVSSTGANSEPIAVFAETAVPTSPSTEDQHSVDEKLLRRIVREELAAQLSLLPASDEDAVETHDPILEAEQQEQREQVEQDIAYYIGVGKISDAEMRSLQADISRLDKEGQKQMLSRLVQALNSGELEGRL